MKRRKKDQNNEIETFSETKKRNYLVGDETPVKNPEIQGGQKPSNWFERIMKQTNN